MQLNIYIIDFMYILVMDVAEVGSPHIIGHVVYSVGVQTD